MNPVSVVNTYKEKIIDATTGLIENVVEREDAILLLRKRNDTQRGIIETMQLSVGGMTKTINDQTVLIAEQNATIKTLTRMLTV